jgi:hypothetical protein
MACTRCGSALAEGGAPVCTVCDPWATTRPPAPPSLGGLPPAPKPLPQWLDRMARRNPPKPADLDRAWRTSLWGFGLTTACCTGLGVAVPCGLGANASLPVVIGVVVAVVTGVGAAVLGARRGGWLARAVAVVGTRPDIGYEGFAALPAIRSMTVFLRRMQIVTPILTAVVIFVPDAQQNVSWSERAGRIVLCFVAVIVISAIQLALLNRARGQLRALIDRTHPPRPR